MDDFFKADSAGAMDNELIDDLDDLVGGSSDDLGADALAETTEAVVEALVDDGTPLTSRKVRKQRRERARSKTIAPKRLTKEEIRIGQMLLMPDVDRPVVRA